MTRFINEAWSLKKKVFMQYHFLSADVAIYHVGLNIDKLVEIHPIYHFHVIKASCGDWSKRGHPPPPTCPQSIRLFLYPRTVERLDELHPVLVRHLQGQWQEDSAACGENGLEAHRSLKENHFKGGMQEQRPSCCLSSKDNFNNK